MDVKVKLSELFLKMKSEQHKKERMKAQRKVMVNASNNLARIVLDKLENRLGDC